MLISTLLSLLRSASGRTTANERRSAVSLRVEAFEDRLTPSGGHLLVTSYDTDSVVRYQESTGAFVDTFVPHRMGGLYEPFGVVFGPQDHNLYVSSGQFASQDEPKAKGILRYNGTTGEFIDEFTERGHLTSPRGIIFGPDGNLYVADGNGPAGKVVRYNGTTGAFIDDFVSAASGGLFHPAGLVFGRSLANPAKLDLYVAHSRGSVLRYDGTTGVFLGEFVAIGSGGLDKPTGLSFGPNGDLYVVSSHFLDKTSAQAAVLRFQGPSGQSPGAFIGTFVPPGSGGLLTPFGLLFGPDGNGDRQQDLYVTSVKLTNYKGNEHTSTVKRYDGVTGAFIDTFVTEGSGGLDQPGVMTFTETDPVTLAYTGATKARAAVNVVSTALSFPLAAAGAMGSIVIGTPGVDSTPGKTTQWQVGSQPRAIASNPEWLTDLQRSPIDDQGFAPVTTRLAAFRFDWLPELSWEPDMLVDLALAWQQR